MDNKTQRIDWVILGFFVWCFAAAILRNVVGDWGAILGGIVVAVLCWLWWEATRQPPKL